MSEDRYTKMKRDLAEKLVEVQGLLKKGGVSRRQVSNIVDSLTSEASGFILGELRGYEVLLPTIGARKRPLRDIATRNMIIGYMREFIVLREKAHGHPVSRRWESVFDEGYVFEYEQPENNDEGFLEWAKDNPHSSYEDYQRHLKEEEEQRQRQESFDASKKEIDDLVRRLNEVNFPTAMVVNVIDYGNDAKYIEEYNPPSIRIQFSNGLTITVEDPIVEEKNLD